VKILVTGAAGSSVFHVALRLLADGHEVVGLDSVNQYYDVRLKEARLALLQQHRNFEFVRTTLADPEAMNQLFDRCEFDRRDSYGGTSRRALLARATGRIRRLEHPGLPPGARGVPLPQGAPFWCMPARARCMGPARRCRFPSIVGPTIRSRCTV